VLARHAPGSERAPWGRLTPAIAALALGFGLGVAVEGVVAQANPLPDGQHRDLVVGACIICHSLETMAQQRLDRGTWETIIERMITYGAPITQETRPQILEYLVRHLGP
jgi:hypothetical protein